MARIIVVDDEEPYRMLMQSVLESAGHEVTCFALAEDALAHLAESSADLFITDVFMPEKEGLETIRELKQSHPGLPVIAVSGGGDGMLSDKDGFLRIAAAFGARAVVGKPFRAKMLLEAAATALSCGAGPSAAA